MKVTFINKSDSLGGAAVVTLRLVQALRQQGVEARMLVTHSTTGLPYVQIPASKAHIRRSFLLDRLPLLLHNGFSRRTLFQIDTARAGLPLWQHPWVRDADIVALGWINQGVLSLKGIRRIAALGKPIVWTMHDMWCMTGICHHAHSCPAYKSTCGDCPLLGIKASPHDLSNHIWKRKNTLYADVDIHFVAVSNWLARKAQESSLLGNAALSVIPNAFPSTPPSQIPTLQLTPPTGHILMVAARLDDPVKGLPILVRAAKALLHINPSAASKLHIDLVGELRDTTILQQIPLPVTHHGLIANKQQLQRLYANASVVVSPSLFETLPGTLIEAQDIGRIPVAFNRGGQADIIDHLHTGYLAQWDDDPARAAENLARGILWAIPESADPARAALMHTSVAQRFGDHAIANRYIALFKSILS